LFDYLPPSPFDIMYGQQKEEEGGARRREEEKNFMERI
jgi:hypothetical protein